MAILRSLRSVKAVVFEVEMNVKLPEEVREMLGLVRFAIT
jgi:hypothetical protein